jgi:hypothetical protein
LRKLGEDAEKVTVGDSIEIDERTGIVRFIGSGESKLISTTDLQERQLFTMLMYKITRYRSRQSNGTVKKKIPN